jgi:hypothetical protein
MLWLLMCLVAVGSFGMSRLHAAVPDTVRKALDERFRLSRVAVESDLIEGRIFNPGTILTLQADAFPAKRFRVVWRLEPLFVFDKSLRPKWVRLHVPDYASVTIAADGRLTAGAGDFTLMRARG